MDENFVKKLNIIRGKNVVGKATKADVDVLFGYIDALEVFLDEASEDDAFGTEGWHKFIKFLKE
jgi:hypothetical protein